MHLKQLKLAGFKSFVDPTVIPFPSQLVAVVGPNGCGKSNIMDALRWVMGESSAKNLRGESMTDVIFNGSSNRKAVGQASVELIFDNTLGRLTGPFAHYGEIALKRIVTREGDSVYYLNGSRCRRRDITDIFLGTGAGSRGYSIIGQGTISKLIEAKPEELRAFLEEAAGVSKYKERRRETLQRIEHTRDNLNRVADLREELDNQLHRLERQAKAAQSYTLFKEQEKTTRAQILALKWNDYTQQQRSKQQQLHHLALLYEQQQTKVSAATKEKILLNERLQEIQEQGHQLQTAFFQLGTVIARLEEGIQQQEREKKRLEHDKQQLHEDTLQAQEQLHLDLEELQKNEQYLLHSQEQLQQFNLQFNDKEQAWKQAQNVQQQKQLQTQDMQQICNTVKGELQIAQVRVEHLESKRQHINLRLEKLGQELEIHSVTELHHDKTQLHQKLTQLKESQELDEVQLKQGNELSQTLRTQLQNTEHQLHQLQDQFHQHNSEHAALIATQKAARQSKTSSKPDIQEWADTKLMDTLQVEPLWQSLCEWVLGESLHAYVLKDLEELWPNWSLCESRGDSVVTLRTSRQKGKYPSLADKIQEFLPCSIPNLDYIYTADNLDQAKSWLPYLDDNESVITANGFWLGKGWVKTTPHEEKDELGFLGRQQKIEDLGKIVSTLKEQITKTQAFRGIHQAQLQDSLDDVKLYEVHLNESNEALRTTQNALNATEQAIENAERHKNRIAIEQDELQQSLEETVGHHLEIMQQWSLLKEQSAEYDLKYSHIVTEKLAEDALLASLNQEVAALRNQVSQAEREQDRAITKNQQLLERISREQERLDKIQDRLEHIVLLSLQSTEPEADLKGQLVQNLQKHQEIETQLNLSREQLMRIKSTMDDLENSLNAAKKEAQKIEEQSAQMRLQEHELAVRASSVQESLDEFELQAIILLETLSPEYTQQTKEEELLRLSEKIKRLGAINLAAVEEFTTEQERKFYLDQQYNDLNQALATLETAIEKMDQETRLRLETTFEDVNTFFKAIFPKLFGGGKAQLELTCDNLLEAGIVVMAQPPGKRNSTIHLLSGGEKAMTAVALVFALFQLNPSPFCMLDEVDAPLDDVNVERFCDLVKEMSQYVQFLFITHNKVTMELADHLIGVTMREPGVSRLVAVDVKDVLAME